MINIKTKDVKKKYQYGFNDGIVDVSKFPKGHSKKIVRAISKYKNEPN
jgi:hypothetical protein